MEFFGGKWQTRINQTLFIKIKRKLNVEKTEDSGFCRQFAREIL